MLNANANANVKLYRFWVKKMFKLSTVGVGTNEVGASTYICT